MKEFFLQMLDARDPSVSSSRFLSIITVLTILYTWAWVSIYGRAIVDIPVGVYTFAGLVVLGKTVGMFAEKPQVSSQTSTETMTKTTVGE
jgi:hypothetical protein